MTLRQNKMKKELFRMIKEILLYDISNPIVSSIEITAVDVSRDMAYCTVFYVTKSKTVSLDELEKALIKISSFVKRKVSQKMRLKKIPDIVFKYDERPEYVNKINSLLGNIEYSKQNEELLSEIYNIDNE